MDSAQPPVRATILVGCAIVVGLVVDVWTDGPPGIGFLLAATVAGLGLLTVIGLNLLDPEAFIAERNIARIAVATNSIPRSWLLCRRTPLPRSRPRSLSWIRGSGSERSGTSRASGRSFAVD